MDDFEKELKIGFLQEAQQLLADTEQCFLQLESKPSDPGILDQIFRLAHNLKGSSKAVGFDAMGAFTHEFESLLLKIKNGEVPNGTESLNLLLRCNDHLRTMVDTLTGNLEASIDSAELTEEVKQAQQGIFAGAPAAEEPAAEPVAEESPFVEAPSIEALAAQETLNPPPAEEISAQELQALLVAETRAQLAMNEAAKETVAKEAPVAAAPASAPVASTPAPAATAAPAHPTAPAGNAHGAPKNAAAADDSIRVSLARLERLLNFVGEMVILQSVLKEQAVQTEQPALRKTVHQLGKVTKEVQDISMSLRMVPVKQTFQKMQRIVRDTAQLLSKKVNLQLDGEETELDKTVLEHLGDPLVHIIRNAVDHGIENADKRRERGKTEAGNVWLSAYHQGGRLVIEVKDDGGGIDGDFLAKKAVEKGILKPGATLSKKDAIFLIFHPGFSTKAQVTEVSGRGVGMDVVKTNIERLSGEIQIDTELGKGTTFKILLPLTLAIIDGMIVKSQEERYIVPLAHVHESMRPKQEDIQWTTGMGEILVLRGENLPLYRMDRLLAKKPDAARDPYDGIAIVVRATGKPFAVFVDDIIGQSQIVIKRLGPELGSVKGFGGSAILGDGRPSLILELPELVQKAPAATKPAVKAPEKSVSNPSVSHERKVAA